MEGAFFLFVILAANSKFNLKQDDYGRCIFPVCNSGRRWQPGK